MKLIAEDSKEERHFVSRQISHDEHNQKPAIADSSFPGWDRLHKMVQEPFCGQSKSH